MKAILCTRYCTPDELELADIPQPTAGPGEALVRVKAAALNFFDLLIIAGKYQYKPPFPFSPASEFAGIVESVGAGVTDIVVGDRVMGSTGHGTAREYIAVPAKQLVKIPEKLDFERAAGLTVTYGTTLYALRERAAAQEPARRSPCSAPPAASALPPSRSARSWARASSPAPPPTKSSTFARAHGADETVNYASEDLRGALKRLGGERGIDVVYDPVGGPYAEPAVRSLGWEGRYLVIGFAAGEIPKLPLNLVLLKSCDIRGVIWGAWMARDPQGQRALMTDIVRWCAEGKLSGHVHAVYPLAEIADRAQGYRRPQGHGQDRAAAVRD